MPSCYLLGGLYVAAFWGAGYKRCAAQIHEMEPALGLQECLNNAIASRDSSLRASAFVPCLLTRRPEDQLPYFALYLIDPSIALYRPFAIAQCLKRFKDKLLLAPCCQGDDNQAARDAVWNGLCHVDGRPHEALWNHLAEKLDRRIVVWSGADTLFVSNDAGTGEGVYVFRAAAEEPYCLLASRIDADTAALLGRRAMVQKHADALLRDALKSLLQQRADALGLAWAGKRKATLLNDIQVRVRELRAAPTLQQFLLSPASPEPT